MLQSCTSCSAELSANARFCQSCGQSTSSSGARGGEDADLIPTTYPPIVIGDTIDGKYRITNKLGEGGMGMVYRAYRLGLDDEVALKFLHPRFAGIASMVERFRLEARTAARVGSKHENVVRIFERNMDRADVLPYLVMEFLDGPSLRTILERVKKTTARRLELWRALRLMKEICRGVSAAHRFKEEDGRLNPVVHRDLKPENIIVLPPREPGGEERVRVVDFGIAKVREIDQNEGGMIKTEPGARLGSLPYQSPEQVEDKPADVRSDVYSLGVMLYEMLIGRRPFNSKNNNDLALSRQIAEAEPPPPPEDVIIPKEIFDLVLRVLSKDPDKRPQDAQLFLEDLHKAEERARKRIKEERALAQKSAAADARMLAAAEVARKEELKRAREEEKKRAVEAADMQKRLEIEFDETQKQFKDEAEGFAEGVQQQLLSMAAEETLKQQKVKESVAAKEALKKQLDKKAATAAAASAVLKREFDKKAITALRRQFADEATSLLKQLDREASVAAATLQTQLEVDAGARATAFQKKLQGEAASAADTLKRRLEKQAALDIDKLQKQFESEMATEALKSSLEKRTADAADDLRKHLREKAAGIADDLKASLLSAASIVSAALREQLEKEAANTAVDLQKQLENKAATAAEAWKKQKAKEAAAAAAAAAAAEQKRLEEEAAAARRAERWKRALSLLRPILLVAAVLLITSSVAGAAIWLYLEWNNPPGPVTNVNVPLPPPTPPPVKPTPVVEQPPKLPKVHTGQVNSIAISPDGNLLASAGADWTVRLWNLKKGEEVSPGKVKYTNAVTSVAFSPNGKLLASSSLDGAVALWNLETGSVQKLEEASVPSGKKFSDDRVFSVTFSPDGNTLTGGSTHGRVFWWNVNNGREPSTKEQVNFWIKNLIFSPDGETLVGTRVPELKYDVSDISPSDIDAQDNYGVILWWSKTRQVREMELSKKFLFSVSSLLFSPDGNTLYIGIRDKVVLWNMSGDKCVCWWVSKEEEYVTSLALSPDGNQIVSARADGTVELWDIRRNIPRRETCDVSQSELGKIRQTPRALEWGDDKKIKVRSLAFTRDGKYVAGGLENGEIRFWSVEDFK